MATNPEYKKPPPTRFGQPEKTNWLRMLVIAALLMVGVWGIVWLVHKSPRMPALNCRASTGAGAWSSFGRCKEEE